MKPRNIHGEWSISIENRLVHSIVSGATNREASLGWFNELQETVESSPKKYDTPWVIFHDCRNWIGAAPDVWETNNMIMSWLAEHNCIFMASLLPGKMQIYNTEAEISDKSILIDWTLSIKSLINTL